MFRSLIHFEFIFVYGVRKCSSFILLQVVDQISQHHLLKRLSLIHCMFLPLLSKILKENCCCSVMSDSLWPQGLQHTKLTYPSPSTRACSNSGPLSWWRHPTISSSVVPFSFCLQSFSASGSFLMSWLFTSNVLELQLIKENMSILFVWFEIYFEGDNNKKTSVTTWIFGICNVRLYFLTILNILSFLPFPDNWLIADKLKELKETQGLSSFLLCRLIVLHINNLRVNYASLDSIQSPCISKDKKHSSFSFEDFSLLYTKTCSYFPWLTFVILELFSLQLSSVTQLYLTLCDPIDCSTPGFPVHPSPTPGACSNSCPSSQWCHPTISSISSPSPPAFKLP